MAGFLRDQSMQVCSYPEAMPAVPRRRLHCMQQATASVFVTSGLPAHVESRTAPTARQQDRQCSSCRSIATTTQAGAAASQPTAAAAGADTSTEMTTHSQGGHGSGSSSAYWDDLLADVVAEGLGNNNASPGQQQRAAGGSSMYEGISRRPAAHAPFGSGAASRAVAHIGAARPVQSLKSPHEAAKHITKLIKPCEDWGQLQAVVQEHEEQLNDIHLSAALCRLVKLLPSHGQQQHARSPLQSVQVAQTSTPLGSGLHAAPAAAEQHWGNGRAQSAHAGRSAPATSEQQGICHLFTRLLMLTEAQLPLLRPRAVANCLWAIAKLAPQLSAAELGVSSMSVMQPASDAASQHVAPGMSVQRAGSGIQAAHKPYAAPKVRIAHDQQHLDQSLEQEGTLPQAIPSPMSIKQGAVSTSTGKNNQQTPATPSSHDSNNRPLLTTAVPTFSLLQRSVHGLLHSIQQSSAGAFEPQEVSNMLYAIAMLHASAPPHISASQPKAAAQARISQPLQLQYAAPVQRLLQHAQPLLPCCTPQGLSNIAYALALLDCKPSGDWMEVFMDEVQAQAPNLEPQHSSNIMWALAQLGYYPGDDWIQSFLSAAAWKLPAFIPQSLSTVLWSLASLQHVPAAPLLSPLLLQVRQQLVSHRRSLGAHTAHGFVSQDYSNSLWALGRMYQLHSAAPGLPTSAAADEMAGRGGISSDRTSSSAVVSASHRDAVADMLSDTAHLLATHSLPLLPSFSTQQLANCAWGLSAAHVEPPPGWSTAFLCASLDSLHYCTMEELSGIAVAVVRLQLRVPPSWWLRFVQAARRALEACGSQALANIGWALATALPRIDAAERPAVAAAAASWLVPAAAALKLDLLQGGSSIQANGSGGSTSSSSNSSSSSQMASRGGAGGNTGSSGAVRLWSPQALVTFVWAAAHINRVAGYCGVAAALTGGLISESTSQEQQLQAAQVSLLSSSWVFNVARCVAASAVARTVGNAGPAADWNSFSTDSSLGSLAAEVAPGMSGGVWRPQAFCMALWAVAILAGRSPATATTARGRAPANGTTAGTVSAEPSTSSHVHGFIRGGAAAANSTAMQQQGAISQQLWDINISSPFAAAAMVHLPQLDGQGLSTVVWALARLRHKPPPALLQSVMRCLLPAQQPVQQRKLFSLPAGGSNPVPLLPTLSQQALCNLLWGFATLGFRPSPSALAVIAYEIEVRSQQLSLRQLSLLLWSLARLQYTPGAAWLTMLVERWVWLRDIARPREDGDAELAASRLKDEVQLAAALWRFREVGGDLGGVLGESCALRLGDNVGAAIWADLEDSEEEEGALVEPEEEDGVEEGVQAGLQVESSVVAEVHGAAEGSRQAGVEVGAVGVPSDSSIRHGDSAEVSDDRQGLHNAQQDEAQHAHAQAVMPAAAAANKDESVTPAPGDTAGATKHWADGLEDW